MDAIETNKQKQLAALKEKFSTIDLVKTSLGYIAFISLGLLFGTIWLNDLINLFNYYNFQKLIRKQMITIDKKNNLTQNGLQTDNHGTIMGSCENQLELRYSMNLEKHLERVHLNLLRALTKRKLIENNLLHNNDLITV